MSLAFSAGSLLAPAIGIVLSFCALVLTVFGLRRKADDSYVSQLEGRIDHLEDDNRGYVKRLVQAELDLEECKRARQEVRDLNFDLMIENRALKRDARGGRS